jgi:hypothetical protein
MVISKKSWLLFILVSVSVATILVAASLSSLELRPGRLFSMESREVSESVLSPLPWFPLFILKIILVIGCILLPLTIIYILFSAHVRKQIFALLTLYLIIYLFSRIPWNKFHIQGQFLSQGEESIPNPPGWLVFAVSLGLSALILKAAMGLWRRLHNRSNPLELIGQEAQKTLEEIRRGANLEDVVIRCYFEMSQVLSRQRGLRRRQAMTTREFENYLEKAGLPGVHIRRLTRLFEKARYGAKNLGKLEDREAIACLRAIVQSC